MATKLFRLRPSLIIVILLFIHSSSYSHSAPSSSSDSSSLLKFKQALKDEIGALSSWNPTTAPCFGIKSNWEGIICSRAGSVWGLRLENMGLSGSIDVPASKELSKLRSISVMDNNFGGNLPDFKQLKLLRALFLANNKFEGSLDPNAFEGMGRLRKLDLSNNKFTGEIPDSLTKLGKLVELKIDGNKFQGPIPDFAAAKTFKFFNVSNNLLDGSIPPSLAQFDPTVFSGNKLLCGPPMEKCSLTKQISSTETQPVSNKPPSSSPLPSPSPSPSSSLSSPSPSEKPIPIVAIVVGVIVAMALGILVILMVLRNRCDKRDDPGSKVSRALSHTRKAAARKSYIKCPDEGSHRSTTSSGSRHNRASDSGKLNFVKDDRERFDLPDLLKAAAEILGSGCFGSSYKATLNNGNSVVVKRFKQMNHVGREEFQEHMRRLGKLSHPNLLPLVAYYYRKEEKLFITDLIPQGSLALLLHGQTRGKQPLDWPTRLKVIKGVATGLSHLYKELNCLIAPHGHLKSSNVLLDESYEPVLSDYGLIPLINPEGAQQLMVAYKSPEYITNGRITKKTDVWALGILIIEIMTGKFPSSYLEQGNHQIDMESWVNSVVEEGFDNNMGETSKSNEGEMQKLLDIGRACCDNDPDKRLDIKEACDRIEEIKERDSIEENDDFYSTIADSTRSSRGTSDEFTTVAIN